LMNKLLVAPEYFFKYSWESIVDFSVVCDIF